MDNNELDATLKLFQDVIMEERQRCLKAVDDEPEWIFGIHDKRVAFAKQNIRKKIEERDYERRT